MADFHERFQVYQTNQAVALKDTTGSAFTGAGNGPGLVPDPGGSPNNPPFYFGDDGDFHAVPTTPGIGGIAPNPSISPNTSTYTVQTTDYMSMVNSFSSGGTLTITLPSSTLPAGFMIGVLEINNDIVLSPSSGSILYANGNSPSSLTLSTQFQTLWLYFDGSNYYLTSPNFPVQSTPTYTTLTSGSSATYNPPSGCTRIKVRMCGGGGGGGALGTNSGAVGTTSSFGSWTAVNGSGGATAGGTGGAGGSGGSNGTGTVIVRFAGGSGDDGNNQGSFVTLSGAGGTNPFGGAGPAKRNLGTGGNASANTGAGGSGGGSNNGTTGVNGAGGGAGEYVEFVVPSPSATTYTVGGGGAGGAAGTTAGGNGAAGIILIEEFYY